MSTSRVRIGTLSVIVLLLAAAAIEVSAHRVIGVNSPALNLATVRSPTASDADMPIPILATGVSVACFRVTNTSPASHITGVGIELPGDLSGFALISPLDRGLSLQEGVDAPGFPGATMDFAVVTGTHFAGGRPKNGIAAAEGVVTICVSGPFPALPIETLLNGVFVGFRGDGPAASGFDIGVWERR